MEIPDLQRQLNRTTKVELALVEEATCCKNQA